jgi:hypothetical protein
VTDDEGHCRANQGGWRLKRIWMGSSAKSARLSGDSRAGA